MITKKNVMEKGVIMNAPPADGCAFFCQPGCQPGKQAGGQVRKPGEAHKLIGLVSKKLMGRGMMLATAESCTGGLIAKLCTDRAGSSDWFLGGVVAYANALKTTLLGVPEETIAENGAVSGPVVRAMALGALEKLGADCSVAVSGIAGPGGGSADKPVGTVWMAVAMRVAKDEGESLVTAERMLCLPGSRDDVRLSAALAVLESLVEML